MADHLADFAKTIQKFALSEIAWKRSHPMIKCTKQRLIYNL